MRSSTLLTSALAVGTIALPQGQLDKRQVVTVTTTVYANPYDTPAWKGPPKFSDPPNTLRPTNAPALPVWSAPRPDAGRSTQAPGVPAPSSTPRASSSPSVNPIPIRSSTPGLPGVTGAPVSTGRPGVPSSSSASPTSLRSSSAVVVGNPISNTPPPSNTVPTPTGAPLDPGPHTPGAAQASLTPSSPDYINAILYHHNAARANHGAAPMVWNASVASTAAITANTCNFAHYIPDGAGQGQNLFTTSGPVFNVTAGITESWYKGEFGPMLGNYGKPSLDDNTFHQVGHLTQVLWKGTTSVGCFSLDCTGRMIVGSDRNSNLNKYTVCNYWPAGNVATQYAINVGSPISQTNLGSWRN